MPERVGGDSNADRHFWGGKFSRSPLELIPLGMVERWSYVGTRCSNEAVGTTAEDLWGAGGVMVYPSVAATCSVVSSDAADDDGSTGTTQVLVTGLDANYLEVQEYVTMDGTTPVVTTQTFLRINGLVSTDVGSGEVNAGNITASVGGNVQRYIAAGEGICHCSQYTVPAGYTAYLFRVEVSTGQDQSADTWIRYRKFDDGGWIQVSHMHTYRNEVRRDMAGAVHLPEKCDVSMQAESGAGTADITGYYSLLLKENES